MPAPYDAGAGRLRASATLAGTYAVVAYVTDAPFSRGSTGSTTTKYLGGEFIKSGDPTLSGSATAIYSDTDTTGQTLIETAYTNGTSVFLQWCPAGTVTGSKVKQFEAKVDSIDGDLNADDEWVMTTFNYTGVPSTLTTVTLA